MGRRRSANRPISTINRCRRSLGSLRQICAACGKAALMMPLDPADQSQQRRDPKPRLPP